MFFLLRKRQDDAAASIDGQYFTDDAYANSYFTDNAETNNYTVKGVTPYTAMRTTVDTFVAFGDSIVIGQGASDTAHSWVGLLGTAMGATVLNKGIAGTVLQNSNDATGAPRSQNGRDRFVSDLLGASKRTMCFINYGYNDLRYTQTPSDMNITNFENDYREIMNGLLLGGYAADDIALSSPYYMGIKGYKVYGGSSFQGSNATINRAYGAVVKRIATDYGVFFADVYDAMVRGGGDSLIGGDDIHPNDSGYAVIAAAVAASTKTTRLSPITNLAVSSPSNQELLINFDAYTSAVSYEVEAGISGTYAFASTSTPATNTKLFTGLAAGSYVARVRAVLPDGRKTPWAFYTTPVSVAASVPLSIDGSGGSIGTGTTSATSTITTTNANDVIVMVAAVSGSAGTAVASVSDSKGLTWSLRKAQSFNSGSSGVEIWWAHAPAALTGAVITVTGNGSTTGSRVAAFAVTGAATPSAPWDANASVPAGVANGAGTSSSVTGVSTNHANNMTISAIRGPTSAGTFTVPTGFTRISGVSSTSTDVSYKVETGVLAAETITTTWTSSTANSGMIVDSIVGN